MLLSLIYFLPCIVSLLWFISFILKKKTYRQRIFCYAEGISVAFYAILGIYLFPDIDYETMVRMESISIPLSVLFPAFLVAYMYMHSSGKKMNDKMFFLPSLKGGEQLTTEESEQASSNAPTPAQIKMAGRVEQFRELMEKKQVWRDEGLTSASLCEMMGIGKTTLSAMISQQYDSTFRDIINNYRIEAAKRYMLENRKATLEIVAQECGFRNAQYFNTQFKR